VFFAQIWIKRADIPAGVDVQLIEESLTLKSQGWVLCGLAARIAALTRASGLSFALRQSFQGS